MRKYNMTLTESSPARADADLSFEDRKAPVLSLIIQA